MPAINTFEDLDQLIEKADGRVKVLEALWNGGTED